MRNNATQDEPMRKQRETARVTNSTSVAALPGHGRKTLPPRQLQVPVPDNTTVAALPHRLPMAGKDT